MRSRVRKFLLAVGAVFFAIIMALWAAVVILKPGPQGRIVLATGGGAGAYQELAELYKKDLARFGVVLELRPKVEGTDTLKALFPQFKSEFKEFDESTADIEAGFIKGGFAESLHGRLASEKEQVWHQRQVDNLRSVGRLFYEPMWVFTRTGERLQTLRDLKGKKVYVGTRVGGARRVALHMLKANGIDDKNATFIDQEFPEDAAPLTTSQADAAILIAPSETPKLQKLLRNPKLQLMDFAAEADAYVNRFPALSKVILREGAVEFDPATPPKDVTLISTSAALVVRTSLNSSLASLLANAVVRNPKSGTDRAGDPILFYKAGEFPNGNDAEFDLHNGARALYKTGELPVLLRSLAPMGTRLGLPFWLAAFVNEHGTQTLLLMIPLLSILVPLFHYLPLLYKWNMRRRLLYWYGELKALEASLATDPSEAHLSEKTAELERIEEAVSRIRVPLPFTDQLYDLRGHIDIVRRRLAPRVRPIVRAAAE